MKVEKNIRIFTVLKEALFFYEEANEFKRKTTPYDLIVFKRLMSKHILLLNIHKITTQKNPTSFLPGFAENKVLVVSKQIDMLL